MSQPTAPVSASSRAAARTPQQIEAEIEAARASLAGTIDVLQHRLSPGTIALAVKDKAVGMLKRDDGSVDPVRVAAFAGVTLVLVVYVVRRRRL